MQLSGLSLDEVLAGYMTPAMESAGFRNRRRQYLLQDKNHAFVLIRVVQGASTADFLTFRMHWTAAPPALAAFHRRENRRFSPNLEGGLFIQTVGVPEAARVRPFTKHEWECRFADIDNFSHIFGRTLRSELLPVWLGSIDPQYLLANDVGLDSPWGYGHAPWRQIFLTIDTGARGELEALLDRAAAADQPAPDLLPWLRQRLADRFQSGP